MPQTSDLISCLPPLAQGPISGGGGAGKFRDRRCLSSLNSVFQTGRTRDAPPPNHGWEEQTEKREGRQIMSIMLRPGQVEAFSSSSSLSPSSTLVV